ncbi:MAG: HAD-IA family hydrolase [Rhizobiaceae bacterium]|nr:HAD-IA family hydrolase [Rhizobiaceae bacterium]MCV0408310.1 HAD-IA family hydrolase [Rhizobiaceae bacterium]
MRALMIDMDGVLVTGRPEDGKPWATDLEKDLRLSTTDLHREFFAQYWDDIVVGRAHLVDCLSPVLERLSSAIRAEELIRYWFEKDSRIDNAVLSDVAAIRAMGIAIHLATNQEHMRASYLMQDLGLSRHVDGIFYSAEIGCRKPDESFFRAIETCTGFEPREILFIDDTFSNVEGALKAGWQAVHWTGRSSLSAILADTSEGFAPPATIAP